MSKSSLQEVAEDVQVPIVAIGASAGGIEAVTELLKHLPADLGMALVYIQHLNRDVESNLVPILQRATAMPVVQVQEGMRIAADTLFVIPPNTDMTLEEDVFKLNERAPAPMKHSPVDVFLISLAIRQKKGTIGILLSGTASDGALGLKAIRKGGGLTYVQDDTAEFQSMTKAAIAEEAVDAVMSPKEIADELTRLSKNRDLVQVVLTGDPDEDTAPINLESFNVKFDEASFAQIIKVLRSTCRVDFSHYKRNTIARRIVRRMLLNKCENMPEYLDYLKKNKPEVNLLYSDLLINVTHFFRDSAANEFLKKEVLPGLIRSKSVRRPIRIWMPACSTGEEAFSLAILILETMGNKDLGKVVQIFATDLSESAIAKARTGMYTVADIFELPEHIINTYFTKVDGHYRVIKRLRDFCVFAPHNVLTDPPFSRVDIISCCNLLIYLDASLQKKVLANFHYALNDKGILVLGKSETVGESAALFTQLDKKVKVYVRKSEVIPKAAFDLTFRTADGEPQKTKSEAEPAVKEVVAVPNLEKTIDNLLLTEYVPAAVVINANLDILHFRGSTSLFLEPSAGKASLNLLKMVRLGLQLEVKSAVYDVLKSGETVKKKDIDITYHGEVHRVAFEVTPVASGTDEKLVLIVFEAVKTTPAENNKAYTARDRRVKQLENELVTLRQEMRSVVEEQEAANEELQSANEEIVSSNEELQSINEELETSKEELESSNEELLTINQELQIRNEQLAEAQEYTQHVIATIREAVLVLDKNLLVKVANEAFYRTFNAKPADTEGKLVYEVSDGIWNIPRLKELLEVVLPVNNQVYAFELKSTFDGVGEKILLLNAHKVSNQLHNQQLILLAIEDITEHRQAEKLLEEREAWLRNMSNNVPVMIWVADANKSFTFLNNTWLAFTGRSIGKETGIGWTEGVYKSDIDTVLSTYHACFNEKRPFNIEYRMRRHDGEYRWILNSAVPTYTAAGEFTGYTGSCTEIHDKRVMNEELEKRVAERTTALQEANRNLERSNNELAQFAYIASHDLQEPLRKIITFSNRLREQYKGSQPAGSINYLDKIVFSSDRMRQLIDDLLNFSRITLFEKKFISTDLNKVLANVLVDFDLLIQEKNAIINAGNLPVIEAIPLQVNQLFYNLLSNALKFIKADMQPVITIEGRKLNPEEVQKHGKLNNEGGYYEIRFRDNGIGFPAEFKEQIFVIFQRLNEKDEYPGTGIGLALCDKIVSNHGGIIYAESEEGSGTTFYLILPEKQL